MPPTYLIAWDFLGVPCDKGVNPVMADRLDAAEKAIRSVFDSLPEDQRLHPDTGEPGATFEQWCPIREVHHGWRPGTTSRHSAGAAVDVNYTTNPYIATRTGTVHGGEAAGRGLAGVREAAVSVYDRAVQFVESDDSVADVSGRAPGESTRDVWNRFARVSGALASYLTFAFRPDLAVVHRRPVSDPENADPTALDSIPAAELKTREEAFGLIEELLTWEPFRGRHPSWSSWDASQVYYRILRDYELVRIPMVIGNPEMRPAVTRNPARGFLDLNPEIAVALCDVGMRWGACDFGPQYNGDIQHFDLKDYGGFTPSP